MLRTIPIPTVTHPWLMPKSCVDCPFNSRGPGLALRKSLAKGRWAEILRSLRSNQHFTCHKTTRETGDGSNKVCRGAYDWQERRGLSANLVRIYERIYRHRDPATTEC